jgi:hypothetical protein
MLESQVGTNARIQVQSDSAFVLWDDIPFTDNNNTDNNNPTTDNNTPAPPSPEWLRRTVCCARYESTQALSERKRAVLAVLAPSSHSPSSLAVPGTIDDAESANSPVPLPAPHPSPGHKFEVRAQGTLVRAWAARAGISVLDVRPTPDGSSEPDLGGAHRESMPGGGRRRTSGPSPEQQQHMHYGGGGGVGQYGGHGGQQAVRRVPSRGQPSLVERPPAVRAMMEAVAQPTRVVRVLARGEKLDP